MDQVESFGESRLLPVILTAVATYSLWWFANGRIEAYGNLSERLSSFTSLVSGDRLTFSFIVDLIYFGIFQGWLVDDDVARRRIGTSTSTISGDGGNCSFDKIIVGSAKYVPFFGLAAYLLTRPSQPPRTKFGLGQPEKN